MTENLCLLNRQKWVKALRSGKYKQGKGYLHHADKYCCLGVAQDLYNKEHPKNKLKFRSSYGGSYLGILDLKVKVWLGIDEQIVGRLIAMNDSLSYSFHKIAKEISRL